MTSESNVQDKDSFMSPSIATWSSWSVGLLFTPVSWSFNKLKEVAFGPSNVEEKVFISKRAVKKQARILQDHVRNAHSYNNIISLDQLMESSEDIDGLSRDGILLALQYLINHEKSVYMEENKEGENSQHHHKLLIKFSEPQKSVTPINHLERSVYNLETTEKFLIASIENNEVELNKVISNVKTCLKDGKKQMAKTHLKKKHILENDITKTMSVLENIQTMLQKVHSSKSDREILQTYKIGAESIKHIFADAGVDVDSVYDVIEDMKEVIEGSNEMQNIISSPLREDGIDDAELEAELKELISEGKSNGGGAGEIKGKVEEPKTDFNLSDLEMRLKRLREEDFPELDGDRSTAPTYQQRPTLTQSDK
jgi:charged multivesicular body protein 7